MRRRDFLKAGGLTAMGLALNLHSPKVFQRALLADHVPHNPDRKLIFIFQRGGSDALNTVMPYGDPMSYSTQIRPTLFIPQADALDLGNGFAGLHPMLAPMMTVYNSQTLTGVDGPGNLAVIHRVGYRNHSQSHFDSQQYWENGYPHHPELEEGLLYRVVQHAMHPDENRFVAAALSSGPMVALKGGPSDPPLPTLGDPANFRFEGDPAYVQKFTGQLPAGGVGQTGGKGVLGAYGGPLDFPGKPYRDLVFQSGLALTDAMSIVQDAVNQGPYTPENGAVYQGSLGTRLRDCAMLMKRTPVRILGVNIGGWDTHTNQGQIYGAHGDLLLRVAQGFEALYLDLQSQWDDLLIITMTEFGRTTYENASFGTDHGNSCVVFAGGGNVRGGVYNCDATTWEEGAALTSSSGRYLSRTHDFRVFMAEIIRSHFEIPGSVSLDTFMPGYAADAAGDAARFTMLNFLS